MNVILDPRNRILYASYYIKGLKDYFGEKNLKYSITPFLSLDRENDPNSFEQYMAFIIKNDMGEVIKAIIDYRDKTDMSKMAYDWCDVYAKINIALDQRLDDLPKLISIPPGFGIRTYNTFSLLWLCLSNLIKCKIKPLNGLYYHFCDYWGSIKYELPISFYENTREEVDNYVFLASTLWGHKNCTEGTNPMRLAFMKACKQISSVVFEGGFFVRGKVPEEYKQFAYHKRIKKSTYLSNVVKSMLVFNTPAVHNCHGWKLGEYLAMGKVIISTPISNQLPQKLEHRKNIYEVNTPAEMHEAVIELMNNRPLRELMKKNNIEYYNAYVKPYSVIAYVINKCQIFNK